MSMYLTPSLLLAAMAGVEEIRSHYSGRARTAVSFLALVLFALPAGAVVALAPPPHRAEEARPVLEELRSRLRPGDAIYAYYAAELAMRFYGSDMEWVQGTDRQHDSRVHFRELDRLRGRPRVWFFYTHGYPCQPEAIRSYLEVIGIELERIEDPFRLRGQRAAEAYLYDLSDPRRLARTDAETHPFEAPTIVSRRVRGCGYNRPPGAIPFTGDRR
jgi:hypothetical protein